MNNEFDNNRQDEYTVNNGTPESMAVNSESQESSNQSRADMEMSNMNNNTNNNVSNDNGNNTGDTYSYNNNQNNYQTYGSNPYTMYSALDLEEGKPIKKRRGFGFIKVVAAALVFGLIAGAAFQGYYVLTNPVTASSSTDSNNRQATSVTQTGDKGDTIVPATSSTDGIVTDVSDVVSKVMPSIVAINSNVNITNSDFFGREYSQEAKASGSGIIIGQNGSDLLIVTNNHVIDGSETVEIVFSDNTTASATVKGADANSDLAVLSVDMGSLSKDTASAIKVATLGNSDDVKAGQMAIAIGNALGYGQSVTVGYISAVNRDVTVSENQTEKLLQTDAAINPGNSGGALLNAAGEVIGINSIKYADTSVEGMGYAIPISTAIPMINELINRQTVTAGEQGYLGIDAASAQNVTETYSQRFNMPVGVYINKVIDGSPAAAAGLAQGDIITGLDGNKITTIDDLVSVLGYKKAGQKVDLVIQTKENGAYTEKTLQVTLGKKK
jgi:serine protease Do